MLKKPLILGADFKYVLDSLEKTKNSMFITGRAGTGKSTLLRLFRKATKKKVIVLAPTGIAALHVQGQTIHSFFGFPPKPLAPNEIKKRKNRSLYKRMEVLVIDEISMVRADMLDNIDRFLRINRENPAPFGGVQMVFFGDLFQLPPVVASDVERMLFQMYYESPYFFSANVLQEQEIELEHLELRKIYRQEGRHFLRLLEAVRLNQLDYDDLNDLNERYRPYFSPEDFYITLTARNATANRINERELRNLDTKTFIYQAKIEGDFKVNLYPTDPMLALKAGAQVMFIKNDPEREFVNGTLGKIKELQDDKIVVLTEEGRQLEVPTLEWEIVKYVPSEKDPREIETKVLGTFKQYPLRLAWGVTIHKAQGKTFDKVIIDLGAGAFEHGQTYVALSRCTTLEGIVLKKALRLQDIRVDERVVEYYETYF